MRNAKLALALMEREIFASSDQMMGTGKITTNFTDSTAQNGLWRHTRYIDDERCQVIYAKTSFTLLLLLLLVLEIARSKLNENGNLTR